MLNDVPPRCAIAIGASAGGVQAVRTMMAMLPADLPAAVLIVLHLAPYVRSLLPSLIASTTPLRVRDVREEGPVEVGCVYVAVPARHLSVVDGRVHLDTSAPVHFVRPSVDRLFESVAVGWGAGAIGVILSGTGADGAAGLTAIKRGGGRTIVQDPHEAAYPGMPRAAIATGCADWVLPLTAIGAAVARAAAASAAGQVA